MAKILCVEDSKEFQLYLGGVLREHNLVYSTSIREALRLAEVSHDSFDLIILDISLPDGNGMRALPQLNEFFGDRPIPIVVISGDSDVLTKVAAFGVGADDYISKPPNSSELRARIEARLRWSRLQTANRNRVAMGNLQLDIEQMAVQMNVDGNSKSLDLTPCEFKILRLLMARPGQVFSREHIVERIWGIGKYVTFRTIDAHISHLRRKLSQSSVGIETVLSAGYKAVLKDCSLN